MKFLRSTLILLVLALCGGAYLFFAERGAAPRQGALILLRTPQNGARSIEFSPSNLKLQRDDTNTELWRIHDQRLGLDAPADPELTKSLLGALELVQSGAPVENPEKFSVYGLEKPRGQLRVDGQSIFFGAAPQFDARRVYARSDAGIALLETTLLDFSRQNFEAWRDKAILRFESDKVTRIALQTPRLRANFAQNGEVWNIENPLRTRADAAIVNSAINTLQSARTTRWLDESGANLKKWGLDKPQATISLSGDQWSAKIEVGALQNSGDSGGYAARTSASRAVFLLPAAAFAIFNRPLKVWRDAQIVTFDLNSAAKIEVEARGARRVLLRDADVWQLQNNSEKGGPDPQKTRAAALDLLDFLGSARAEEFVDEKRSDRFFGFDKPVLTLKITAQNGDVVAAVRFGKAGGKISAQNWSGGLENQAADKKTTDKMAANMGTVFVLSADSLDKIQSALNKILPPISISKTSK